jgi:hypothetical protein
MKAERRKTVVSIADTQLKDGFAAWFGKHGNTLLTGILIAMAVALLVRWRLNAATVEKQRIVAEVNDARAQVDQLRNPALAGSAADLIRNIESIETKANADLSDMLNTSSDADVKAQALAIRGDLYWQLANLPELPGAAVEPNLRLKKTPDELLAQSADAYNSVVNSSDYASAHDSINAARLGLTAIAENRGEWAKARTLLDAIKNDPNASGEKLAAADVQLDMMVHNIQDPIYIAPPEGTGSTTTATTQPAIPTTVPIVSTTAPVIPTTLPLIPKTVPGIPTTAPVIPTTMPVIPLTLPATRPAH